MATMHYVTTSAKALTAAGLLLVSPIVLLFMGPLVVGVTSDLVHVLGPVPTALGFSGAMALFALYRLQNPD